jgi:CysZ protein
MADNSPHETLSLTRKLLPAPFYVLRGALFLKAHRKLWKYAAAPLAISAVILTASYWLLYHLFARFSAPYSDVEWYWRVLYYLVLAVVGVVLLIVFFFLFTRLASALAAPFNDLISQKTEELVTGAFIEAPFSVIQVFKDSARSIYHSLKILGLYLGLLLATLPLLLIPGVGGVLFSIAGTLLSAFMFSWEYLNYPLDRRKFSWSDKRLFFQSSFRSVMGFGLGSVAMAAIPVVNLLFIPAAVVGGTLLFLDLQGDPVSPKERHGAGSVKEQLRAQGPESERR